MINPILESFPDFITVEDVKYKINTDFRLWLKMFYFSKKEDKKALNSVLYQICPEIDENPTLIIEQLKQFATLAEHLPKSESKVKARFSNVSKAVFDMYIDSDVIYADFMRDYSIDLNTAEIHWLKFKILLNGLSSKSSTEQRKSFRDMDLKQIDKRHRLAVKRTQEALSIEPVRKMSLADRDRNMKEYVKERQNSGGFKK